MDTLTCRDVQEWLQPATQSGHLDPPSAVLAQHVAECAQCRGTLLLLLATFIPAPLHLAETTCQQCQDDLAAYIDLERDAGTLVAAQSYPHVLWHLMLCPECFTTYQMTNALLDAEQRGTLVPLRDLVQPAHPAATVAPVPVPPERLPRLFKRLHIPRIFLSRTLAVQPLLGIMRGSADADTVLLDESASGYTMTLSVQRQDDGSWNVLVTVVPPMRGQIALTFGTTIFRAPFNAAGQAIIPNLPDTLLTASEGPDMDLSIEPESTDPDPSATA